MKKAFNFKIIAFLGLLFSLFLCVGPTAHAASTGLAPGENPEIYNTEWSQANVKYWTIRGRFYWGLIQKTNCYLRITDQNGNFINDVVRLKAKFYIDGKQHLVNKDIKNNTSGFFSFGNLFSKDGEFVPCTKKNNDVLYGKEFYDSSGEKSKYEECNYRWCWNFNIEKIVYLYVWYLDAETGKEVAGSFMPDGAHPLYDENGVLKGIYDVNGNPLDDYSMGADGIIEDKTGKDLVIWEDQFEGGVTEELEIIDIFTSNIGNISNGFKTTISIIFYILLIVLFLLIFGGLYKIGKKLVKWVKS